MRRIVLITLTLALYAIVISTTLWALFAARHSAIASYGNSTEQANWDEFRAEMDEQHVDREALREEIARGSGQPISPKPPKSRSDRPPALELLTDHFAACVSVALLAVSGLFAVVWGMIVGAVLRPGRRIGVDEADESPSEVRPPSSIASATQRG